MVATAKTLREQKRSLTQKARELFKKGDAITPEERAESLRLVGEAESLIPRIEEAEAEENRGLEAEKRLAALEAGDAAPAPRLTRSNDIEDPEERKKNLLNGRAVKRWGRIRHFTGPDAEAKAYRFGMWFMAFLGHEGAQRFCKDAGLVHKESRLHSEGTNTAGGYLVPDEFMNDVIDLKEAFGVFRRFTKVVPMLRETKSIPRRTSGLTAYFPGEGGAGTESTKAWDNVNLVAQKAMVITRMTAELSEDAAINVGDDLAAEIAYAMANLEDNCGFIGTGTSTYGGMVGFMYKIATLNGTRANIASLVVATGNLWSEFVIGDYTTMIARLPQYADTPNCAWFVHRKHFFETMLPLLNAAGGQTQAEREAGARGRPMFLGYPVEFAQVLPKVDANDQATVGFGDLSLGTVLGDRRELAIQQSDQASVGGQSTWERDEIALRGITRFHSVCHGTGNVHATAASRAPGPIIVMSSAAS